MQNTTMICDVTLKVKHLPACLSADEKEDFLKHFGAVHVKVITSIRNQKSVVYGKFENKQMTKAVLHRIHQLRVLDSILCVEYAEKKIADTMVLPMLETKSKDVSSSGNKKHYINYVTRLNALNSAAGFDQPPPPHLHYVYPKANPGTINNISFALDTVPQFYYQVLHLMNRMNLPPPFSNPNAEMHGRINANNKQIVEPAKVNNDSESELESDLEDNDKNNKLRNIIPIKRTKTQRKAIKRPKFIKPTVLSTEHQQQNNKHENENDVFEKVDIQQKKSILLNLPLDELLNSNTEEQMNNANVIEEHSNEAQVQDSVITEKQLSENRLQVKDLSVLPVFKDYHPGVPNSKLYIKNISKSVEMSDLEFIFKRYQSEQPNDSAFEIKHMKEGRMKGQAFVTLSSIDLAQKALKETNGYILKDKPIVVVFAKVNCAKK